jgi:hypothetical protein
MSLLNLSHIVDEPTTTQFMLIYVSHYKGHKWFQRQWRDVASLDNLWSICTTVFVQLDGTGFSWTIMQLPKILCLQRFSRNKVSNNERLKKWHSSWDWHWNYSQWCLANDHYPSWLSVMEHELCKIVRFIETVHLSHSLSCITSHIYCRSF